MATMPRGAPLIDERGLGRARVHDRQRPRHGGRAAGDAGDVRGAGAAAGRRAADDLAGGARDGRAGGDASPRGSAEIQGRYPALDLGSYPFYRSNGNGVAMVAKGTDAAAAEAAIAAAAALLRSLGGEPVPGEPPA